MQVRTNKTSKINNRFDDFESISLRNSKVLEFYETSRVCTPLLNVVRASLPSTHCTINRSDPFSYLTKKSIPVKKPTSDLPQLQNLVSKRYEQHANIFQITWVVQVDTPLLPV